MWHADATGQSAFQFSGRGFFFCFLTRQLYWRQAVRVHRRWRSNNFVLFSSRTRIWPFYHDVYVRISVCALYGGKERKKKIWFIMRHLCIVIRLRVGYLAFDEWESGKGFFLYISPVRLSRTCIYIYIIRTYDLK